MTGGQGDRNGWAGAAGKLQVRWLWSGHLSNINLAFYDALGTNESARLVMQDEALRKIAHELTEIVRSDAKTDWQVKETVRAKLRTRIKRLLLKHGYPPDQEPSATDLIIQQAEVMAEAGAA